MSDTQIRVPLTQGLPPQTMGVDRYTIQQRFHGRSLLRVETIRGVEGRNEGRDCRSSLGFGAVFRSNRDAAVIASEAKQSRATYDPLDCFVASLLAMTVQCEREPLHE
jgi:hypothetical protein